MTDAGETGAFSDYDVTNIYAHRVAAEAAGVGGAAVLMSVDVSHNPSKEIIGMFKQTLKLRRSHNLDKPGKRVPLDYEECLSWFLMQLV